MENITRTHLDGKETEITVKPYKFIQRIHIATNFANAVMDIIQSKDTNEVKVNRIEQALERQDAELELWAKENE